MQIPMDSKLIPELTESEVIDVDDIDGGKEAFLVGRLLTDKNWDLSNLIEAITEAWKMKHGGMSSREFGDSKLILFRFDDVMDRDWVLKHQPWYFEGSLFAIKEFTGGNEHLSSLDSVSITHASFWARLYDVPISCMNERSLKLFAKQIGILESVDKSDEDSIGRFLRFKVSVNITKPLVSGITNRAKGKNLWLPLKYESLPIYCFSCGIINHDNENCHSYSACQLSAPSSKRRKTTEHPLPIDIIENILSRVPVKYLHRFKVVSKQWKATISDPRFAEIHLQQYKKSSSQNLFLIDYCVPYVGKLLKNGGFEVVASIEPSSKYRFTYRFMRGRGCYCDGLYLIFRVPLDLYNTYVLWNPSSRAYKEISCQPIKYVPSETITGIYYNPIMKDYKLVIADSRHYAVYSCRYNIWSKVEGMKYYSRDDHMIGGAHCGGSFYWLIERFHTGGVLDSRYEILCFDGRDENFKKLSVPYCGGVKRWLWLTSSGSHLCLLGLGGPRQIFMLRDVNSDEKHSFMKFELRDKSMSLGSCFPHWVSENEFILEGAKSSPHDMLLDLSKNSITSVQKIGFHKDNVYSIRYLENLFLQ